MYFSLALSHPFARFNFFLLFFLVAHLCFALLRATVDILHTFCQYCKYSEFKETFWKQ